MKITNRQILGFLNSNIASKNLPVKLAYAIAANIEAVKPALEAYNRQRTDLIEKYAKKDEEGKPIAENGNYVFDDPEGWSSGISELLEAEAEISATTVPVDLLEKCDTEDFDSLNVADLSAINFMIVD